MAKRNRPVDPEDRLMTPAEVAAVFRVKARTVTSWAIQGWLHAVRTPGGHRRYRETEVRELLDMIGEQP